MKRTLVSAAAAGGAPRYPQSFVFADSPGGGGGRDGRGRRVFICQSVGIHAAELHHVKEPGEILNADPSRESRGPNAHRGDLLSVQMWEKLWSFTKTSKYGKKWRLVPSIA